MPSARIFILSFFTFIVSFMQLIGSPLESFLWKQRIVLISTSQAGLESIVKELKGAEIKIDERHIYWFVLSPDSLATNCPDSLPEDFRSALQKEYFNGADETTQIRLVGKDGGLKSKQSKLKLESIFALIDTMPMRRAEMQRSENDASGKAKMLFDFRAGNSMPRWRSNNDGVMGGLSQGSAKMTESGMEFSGVLSLENNGGFSSVYQQVRFNLSEYDGIRFEVLGDGRRYQLRLRSDALFRPGEPVNFGHEFDTVKGEWTEVFVPFSELRQSWRGRKLSGYPLNASDIRRVAFMLADKQAGEFSLKVRWLAAHYAL